MLVVGGGFGGLNAALELSNAVAASSPSASTPEIVLIDRKERFVFLPLLYELAVGDATLDEVAPTYDDLLRGAGGAVTFRRGELKGVDAPNDEAHWRPHGAERDEVARYDALIVATGLECDVGAVPGATEHALPFYTVEHCYELRRRLARTDNASSTTRIVVVGGGYSGVELAANLAGRRASSDHGREVTLLHRGDAILEGVDEFQRDAATRRLTELGVDVKTGVSVDRVSSSSSSSDDDSSCVVETSDGDVACDLLLWTAGARPAEGALNSVLPRDTRGRVVTNDACLVRDTDNVFCVGDAARGRKEPHPANAQVAIGQAPVAARNALRVSTRDDSLPARRFRHVDLGSMMTLGSEDATVSSLGGAVRLDGRLASAARRLVYAVRMPTNGQRVRAAVLSAASAAARRARERRARIDEKQRRTNNK